MTTTNPPVAPAPEPDACQLSTVELRRVTAALEHATAGWFTRHQATTIFLAAGVVALGSWVVTTWSTQRVLEVQAPVDAKQDERTSELEENLSVERVERENEAARLRQNDADIARYLEESDQYDRAVLKEIAEKVRVKDEDLPDRAPLDRAAESVRAIKNRGRAE